MTCLPGSPQTLWIKFYKIYIGLWLVEKKALGTIVVEQKLEAFDFVSASVYLCVRRLFQKPK